MTIDLNELKKRLLKKKVKVTWGHPSQGVEGVLIGINESKVILDVDGETKEISAELIHTITQWPS